MGISKDMKYTALYWALRFVECEADIHEKRYGGYRVTIDAEAQSVDFGDRITADGRYPLTSHKSFVVLECVDRLLTDGTAPERISIGHGCDVAVDGIAIECIAWDDYRAGEGLAKTGEVRVAYTSRLVSGLLEYKGSYARGSLLSEFGYGTAGAVCVTPPSPDYEIVGDELVRYKGSEETVRVPDGIVTIGASAFWNNTSVKEVILPETLERIGGDCFYYCTSLLHLCIPPRVRVMGNNPFAGCPQLTLENKSPHFLLEDGVLYDKDKRNLIHYTIRRPAEEFSVPDGVVCLGKHCFFSCDTLRRIVIPQSVIRMENNPFSGCTHLSVESHSPYYHFENGVIYNRYKTTVIGCLNGTVAERLVLPESVTLISRNSFWSCKGIRGLVIPKGVARIGYNPFAGCENLFLESESPLFPCVEGIVYNKDKTQMLCATNRAVGRRFRVPDGVTHVGRGVFSGCASLEEIDLGGVTYIDKSAFTSCTSLSELYIPSGVSYIGEWAFAYCTRLARISIPRHTKIDKNAFNECPAEIEWRDE